MKKIDRPVQIKNNLALQKNLKALLQECNIIEAELSRQTGLPQTTINKLLLGETADPRATTLISISKFFGITVGQLLGEEPLNPKRIIGSFSPINRNAWNIIPIINWEEAKFWKFSKEKYTPSNHENWITTENECSQDSFALKTIEFMTPRFKKNSTIIVDPNYKFKDGNYIVISINSGEATVRQIVIDGSEIYLKKLYKSEEAQKFSESDTIIGTITETRISEK